MRELRLLRGAERRIRLGHPWIFSNEVDVVATPLTAFTPGERAIVSDARGGLLGVAFVNPHALIAARVLSTDAHAKIDAAWMVRRIRRVLVLRERLYPAPYYRLIYGESDGLPGLIIDRYGDSVVVQINAAGMLLLRDPLLKALEETIAPRAIALRVAESVRELEGMPPLDEELGELPEFVEIPEGELLLLAPLRGGQKTGFYYDQRENRARLASFLQPGERMLDLYGYVGAWACTAAALGASEVLCVDASESALALAQENASRNGLTIRTERADVSTFLEAQQQRGGKFDLAVVDPPALVKRKRDLAPGMAHYERVNRETIRLLREDGILMTFSCSQHVASGTFAQMLQGAARKAGRRALILAKLGQPPDHPIHVAMPQSEYLKGVVARV